MKRLVLLVAAALMTSAAQARTVAEVREVGEGISSIKLSEAGLLTVVIGGDAQKVIQLSASNTRNLVSEAQALVDIETVTTVREFVCMTLVAVTNIQDLYIESNVADGLILTSSNTGCYRHSVTVPKESYLKRIANDLKMEMVILAKQLI